MNRVVTAAQQLQKLAEDLEKEAAEQTVFACLSCGHSSNLQEMNASIRKRASSFSSEKLASFNLEAALVTVNDQVRCPTCKTGTMSYLASAESERFYITATEDIAPSEKPLQDAPDYGAGMEAHAGLDPRQILSKMTALPGIFLKQVHDAIPEALKDLAGHEDSALGKDKHNGVDPSTFHHDSVWEIPRNPLVQEGLRELRVHNAMEEKDAFLGGKSKAVALASLFLAIAPQIASAGGHGHVEKTPEAMQRLFDKVMGKLKEHSAPANLHDYQVAQVDQQTGAVSKTTVPAPADSSSSPFVSKAATLVNNEKLASYLM
jgi:hypothetical protein